MAGLIDKAVAHFSSKAIRELDVPEWGSKLFAKNMSLDDKAKWYARADGDASDYLLYAIIFGVTDEKGDPIFNIGDKHKLRNKVDPEIISRIANWVVAHDDDSEEIRGN
jgi:hypothetical protein